MSGPLNNWDAEKVIKKEGILELEFLADNGFVTEIEDGYFYLNTPLYDVEKKLYDDKNRRLEEELNLTDPQQEIKTFIQKMNRYNQAKDIAQSLMGKIAYLRGVPIRQIHEDMDVDGDTG